MINKMISQSKDTKPRSSEKETENSKEKNEKINFKEETTSKGTNPNPSLSTDFIVNVLYKERFIFNNQNQEFCLSDINIRFLFICEIIILYNFEIVFKFVVIDYKKKEKRLVFINDDYFKPMFYLDPDFKKNQILNFIEKISVNALMKTFLDFFQSISLSHK